MALLTAGYNVDRVDYIFNVDDVQITYIPVPIRATATLTPDQYYDIIEDGMEELRLRFATVLAPQTVTLQRAFYGSRSG